MIKYRPHMGTLDDAMKEVKEFSTLDDMYIYIVASWQGFGQFFSEKDVCVSDSLGSDERVGWKDCRYVCTRRMGEEVYDTPQCIGICSIE